MTLHYIRNVNQGEQNPDGSYIKVHDDLTICDDCLIDKGWGHEEIAADVPGEKCELCDYTG
jgi:hypothetical protein